jgi:putative transposase
VAWPDDWAPAFLIRDRDNTCGSLARDTLQGMNLNEIVTAPRSPWQNPFVERVIGSIRRDSSGDAATERTGRRSDRPDP